MPVKLIVLYPPPTDPEQFERDYVDGHLPLMRRLLGPDVLLPTYKVLSQGSGEPIYRVAEIYFARHSDLETFIQSGKAEEGRASSEKVSTGGKPLFLVCDEQPAVNAMPVT